MDKMNLLARLFPPKMGRLLDLTGSLDYIERLSRQGVEREPEAYHVLSVKKRILCLPPARRVLLLPEASTETNA